MSRDDGPRLPGAFQLFLTGRAISLAGGSMSSVALTLAVLDTTDSAGDLGVILAAQMVPHIVLLLVGGAVADRFPRRLLLVGSHLGSGLTQLAVAAILISGAYDLLVIAVLAALGGALTAFTTPALVGIVNEIVPAAAMQRATSLLAATRNLTKILGPVAAGLLVVSVGGGWAIAIDGMCFLVAVMFLVKLPQGPRTADTGHGWAILTDIRAGWAAFGSLGWLWPTTACFFVVNLVAIGPWQILGPTLVQDHHGTVAWGTVLSVRAIGLLGGSVLAYHLPTRYPLRAGQLVGAFGGAALITVGLDVPFPWLLGCALIAGVSSTALGVGWETALQQNVPREVISRVSAIADLLSYLAIPIGQLLTAPTAASWGAGPVTVTSGIAFTLAVLAPLMLRRVRDLTAASPEGR